MNEERNSRRDPRLRWRWRAVPPQEEKELSRWEGSLHGWDREDGPVSATIQELPSFLGSEKAPEIHFHLVLHFEGEERLHGTSLPSLKKAKEEARALARLSRWDPAFNIRRDDYREHYAHRP